jgi:hypothetical protein
MFNGKGYNLSDIAAVTRNGDGDGMFGNNGWWIILLFLFAGWGRGFGGFGGLGGGEGAGLPCATQADVRAAVDQQTLISKLDQQTYGLADSTYALNSAITNGFHGVDTAICTLGYNMQGGFNTLGHQISDCCCENGRAMERGFADLGYAMATQTNAIQQAMCNNTRDIIDANNAGVRSILDFLVNDKIATLTAENQNLKFAASQAAQNAYLVNELRPCPVPAYTVPNPYCCNTYFGNCGNLVA